MQHQFYECMHIWTEFSLQHDWWLLIAQQVIYLFSTMFAGAESDCDVINVLWQKHNLEMFPYVFQLC